MARSVAATPEDVARVKAQGGWTLSGVLRRLAVEVAPRRERLALSVPPANESLILGLRKKALERGGCPESRWQAGEVDRLDCGPSTHLALLGRALTEWIGLGPMPRSGCSKKLQRTLG